MEKSLRNKFLSRFHSFKALHGYERHDDIGITFEEFQFFVLDNNLHIIVEATKGHRAIKRIDESKPWHIENTRVELTDLLPKTEKARQNLSKPKPQRPIDPHAPRLLTPRQWVEELKAAELSAGK